MARQTTTSTRTFMTPPPEKSVPKPPKTPRNWPKLKLPVNRLPWLLVIALVLFSAFLFSQYRQAIDNHGPAAATKQVKDVTGQVGKLMLLPGNETPTVYTIGDVSKLKEQAFFADAKDGDKVLVYSKKKQAILFRPSVNKIVTVAPVNISSDSSLTPQKP